ncbi:MAG: GNAT family N-acetyltransferase [Bacteroidales bacterium]|nr:GNAT family N-acetyltransferase [Bacteroidales bacterium]
MEYIIRELRMDEVPLLNDFLYEAIYIPFGGALPPRSIILNENLQIYVRDFGTQPDDKCLVVEIGGRVVGAVWSRIMNDYGHVADDVPSLAISLYKEFRNHGIGSELLGQMLQLLRRDGYHKVSLSVQKENYAVGMYLKAGFQVWEETSEENIMTYNLDL